jgi:hypothetical protein
MGETEIIETEPGVFVKKRNGREIGSASSGEIITYHWKLYLPEVDAGILEVALALSAIMAVISAADTHLVIKVVTGVAFIFCLIGCYSIYTVYIMTRLPLCITEYVKQYGEEKAQNFSRRIYIWIIFVWPVLGLVQALRCKDPSRGYALFAEFGYLMLYWGLLLAGIMASIFIVYTFL